MAEWTRRKLRCVRLKQRKRGRSMISFLVSLGVPPWRARKLGGSGRPAGGGWPGARRRTKRHEQPVVQGAGACQPHRKVSCATILRRTAGYGPVRPVVWGDGGREPPSHPMCARHALCLEQESLTDGGSTGDRMDSPGPWGTGDVCDRAG